MDNKSSDITDVIKINMFGGFSMKYGEKIIRDSSARTSQIRILIEYLIAFRGKRISTDELINALWSDGSSERPTNALKNLVYRARNTLETNGFPNGKQMIVFQNGSYCWNNSYPCEIDTEKFEELCQKSADINLNKNQRIEYCMEALKLYKGNFLPDSCYEEWVISLAGYYNSLFLKTVYQAVALLESEERYDEVVAICERAILIEKYEEKLHRHLILAMYKMGHSVSALGYYRHITQMFYDELGVKETEEMRQIYRQIISSTQDVEISLMAIINELKEENIESGPFVCEYEIFKKVYQLENRNLYRTGENMFICLFTVTDSMGKMPNPELLNIVMYVFNQAIKESLRNSDIMARYSPSQFVILLPRLTYENAKMVMNRVIKNFKKIYKGKPINIVTSVQPINAFESNFGDK